MTLVAVTLIFDGGTPEEITHWLHSVMPELISELPTKYIRNQENQPIARIGLVRVRLHSAQNKRTKT